MSMGAGLGHQCDQSRSRIPRGRKRCLEGKARHHAAAAQVEALGIDARHLPIASGLAQESRGIKLHRVGMISIHVADDLVLGNGESRQ